MPVPSKPRVPGLWGRVLSRLLLIRKIAFKRFPATRTVRWPPAVCGPRPCSRAQTWQPESCQWHSKAREVQLPRRRLASEVRVAVPLSYMSLH